MQVPKRLSQLCTKIHALLPTGNQPEKPGGKGSHFAATSPARPGFPSEGTTPRKHQYFMGCSLLASNCAFNCHETIQNFQLRANGLPSATQPEQAWVIILKASDRAAHHTGSPSCLSVIVAMPFWTLSALSPHTAADTWKAPKAQACEDE